MSRRIRIWSLPDREHPPTAAQRVRRRAPHATIAAGLVGLVVATACGAGERSAGDHGDADVPSAPPASTPTSPNPTDGTVPDYANLAATVPALSGATLAVVEPTSGDVAWLAVSTEPFTASRMAIGRAGAGVAVFGGGGGGGSATWTTGATTALERLAAGEAPAAVLAAGLAAPTATPRRQLVVALRGSDGRHAEHVGDGVRLPVAVARDDLATAVCTEVAGEAPADALLRSLADRDASVPLPERLLVALEILTTDERLRRPLRSAHLRMLRPGADPAGGSDVLLDVRVDHAHDPLARLAALYPIAVASTLRPRLRDQLRRLEPGSDTYSRTREWLRRIERGVPLGAAGKD